MAARADRASGARVNERDASVRGGAGTRQSSARLESLASADPHGTALVERLLDIAVSGLTHSYQDGEFVFRLDCSRSPGGVWQLAASGKSLRYSAIAALGLLRLPEPVQRSMLGGDTCAGLISRLTKRLGEVTSPGEIGRAHV